MLLLLLFSLSVLSESLWSHGLQHARLPCPSLSPRVCSNSCLLSRWCHPTISPSVTTFSSYPQYIRTFPYIMAFSMSQLFSSGGQTIGALVSASVLPGSIQDWSPLELTDLIFLLSKGLSRVFSSTTVEGSAFFTVQLSHPFLTTGKTIALTRQTFVSQVMSLLFNNTV